MRSGNISDGRMENPGRNLLTVPRMQLPVSSACVDNHDSCFHADVTFCSIQGIHAKRISELGFGRARSQILISMVLRDEQWRVLQQVSHVRKVAAEPVHPLLEH